MPRLAIPAGAKVSYDDAPTPTPAATGRARIPTGAAISYDDERTQQPEAQEPGYLEALGRGVKQGVTLGFGDEITGFLESAFTDKTYQQARDEARAKDKAAQKAHGITFGLGQIMGGAAPAIATGGAGGLAGAIRAGAGLGAASAAGESEADLSKGEFTRLASDTARGGIEGGIAGGVLHGVGRGLSRILGSKGEGLIEGAATRADKRLLRDIGETAPKAQREALAAAGDHNLLGALRDEGLGSVARKPGQLEKGADAAIKRISHETADLQGTIDTKIGDVQADRVVTILERQREALGSNPATQAQAERLDKLIQRVRDTWVPDAPTPAPPPPAPLAGRDLLAAATKGAAGKTRERLGMKADQVEQVIKHFKLDESVANPEAFANATSTAKVQVGKQIGAFDEAIDATSHGIPLFKVMQSLHRVEQTYDANPATKDVAKIIARKIEQVREAWQDLPGQKGIAMVPIAELRKFAGGLAESGFAGSALDPKTTSRIQRQAWGAVKDLIENHVEDTIKRMRPQKFAGFNAAAKPGQYAELNRQYSVLTDLDKIATRRAVGARLSPTPVAVPAEVPIPRPVKSGLVSPADLRAFASNAKVGGAAVNDFLAQEAGRAAPELAARMHSLGGRQTVLEAIRDAARERALGSQFEPSGLRSIAGHGMNALHVGHILSSPMTGIPTTLAVKGAPIAMRGANVALAALVRAARSGSVPAQLVQDALEAGVPRATVAAVAGGTAVPAEAAE
jgi:hypothetical protein